MVASKPFAAIGVLLAGVALSACTSAGQTSSASAAKTTTHAYPQLPDMILTVPAAYSADMTGGPIAEASAMRAVAAAAPQASEEVQAAVVTAADAAAEVPSPQPEAANGDGVMVASLAPETGLAPDAGLAGVVPASFAGPTPSSAALATQPFDTGAPAQGTLTPIHAPDGRLGPSDVGPRSAELDALMAKYADHYEIPEELVRRVAKRESTFNPKARNGPYWGLMQIRHDTAKGMGYQGSASGLLDAETNLKYAVRYLRGAFLVARGNLAVADKLYQRGYYYDAKRAGLLDETGLGKDRRRRNPS